MKKISKAEIAKQIKELDKELDIKISKLKTTYKNKKSVMIEKYINQISYFRKGDVIANYYGRCTIRITEIGHILRNGNFIITYSGDEYAKGSMTRDDRILFNKNRQRTFIDDNDQLILLKKPNRKYPLLIDDGEKAWIDRCHVDYTNNKPTEEILKIPVKLNGITMGYTNENADTIIFIDDGIATNLMEKKHVTVYHKYKRDVEDGRPNKDKELDELIIYTNHPDKGYPIKNITNRTCKKVKRGKYYE